MSKPYIVAITGESGVGKSTVAEMVALFFGVDDTTILSTDDLHKWERTNPHWKTITHLNPEANNLELGDIHLMELSQGKPIFRSVYNHHTGCFNPPLKIEPKKVIVTEGLHAFYSKVSKELTDLKIFIDTDEDLRVHWKIIRDTEERGYKYNVVLESIANRRLDNEKIRAAQINDADVIIKMTPSKKIKCLGDKHEIIDMSLVIIYNKDVAYKELFTFIERYNDKLNEFVKASESIGNDISLCQDNGGNISTKMSSRFLVIKSSGFKLKDVGVDHGFSLIDYQKITESKLEDEQFDSFLSTCVLSDKYKRPSMEAGFHAILPSKHVLHLHPAYLTLLLCLDDSKRIIEELFLEFDYAYIDYANPGYDLFTQIKKQPNREIYFLANHGVVVTANDMTYGLMLLNDIADKAKEYIEARCTFEEFSLTFSNIDPMQNHTFPDSVIFADDSSKREVHALRNYIERLGNQMGKLRHLSHDNVRFLNAMESEKYRKSL